MFTSCLGPIGVEALCSTLGRVGGGELETQCLAMDRLWTERSDSGPPPLASAANSPSNGDEKIPASIMQKRDIFVNAVRANTQFKMGRLCSRTCGFNRGCANPKIIE